MCRRSTELPFSLESVTVGVDDDHQSEPVGRDGRTLGKLASGRPGYRQCAGQDDPGGAGPCVGLTALVHCVCLPCRPRDGRRRQVKSSFPPRAPVLRRAFSLYGPAHIRLSLSTSRGTSLAHQGAVTRPPEPRPPCCATVLTCTFEPPTAMSGAPSRHSCPRMAAVQARRQRVTGCSGCKTGASLVRCGNRGA